MFVALGSIDALWNPLINKIVLGKAMKRRITGDWWARMAHDRDEDLSGWAYKTVGLDGISDEPSGPSPPNTFSHKDKRRFMYY